MNNKDKGCCNEVTIEGEIEKNTYRDLKLKKTLVTIILCSFNFYLSENIQ